MLGAIHNEKINEDKMVNSKLIAAYQKAYESYHAACDRYDKLVQAYRVLKGFTYGKAIDAEPDENDERLPHTERMIKRMIEEANNEKAVIADHARECIRHLRSLKYEM